MTWLLSIFAKRPVRCLDVVEETHPCAFGHVRACRCFADLSAKHDDNLDFIACPCVECVDLRLARVRYWSELWLDRDYDRHVSGQMRSRKRMDAAQATVVDPEIANVTKIDPELAIVTWVEERVA
jgi:hypothetical protein